MERTALVSLSALIASLGIAWLLVVLEIPAPAGLLLFAAVSCCLAWFLVALWRQIQPGAPRVAVGVILALLALPLAIVAGALSSGFVNDIRLSRFSAQLFQHPLPPNTRQIAASSNVGVLAGNGNHCDFIARLEVSSDLPVEALRAHYAALELRPAIPGNAGGDVPRLDVYSTPGGTAGVYSVVATDAGYEGIFDIRCH